MPKQFVVTQEDLDVVKTLIRKIYPNINTESTVYIELISAGNLAVAEAVIKYKPGAKSWFSFRNAYITWAIRGAMRSEVQTGFMGMTKRGRNPEHEPIKMYPLDEVQDEYADDTPDLDELLLLAECRRIAVDYLVQLPIDLAVKLFAVLLCDVSRADVARTLNCSRPGVGKLVRQYKQPMYDYVRKHLKEDKV